MWVAFLYTIVEMEPSGLLPLYRPLLTPCMLWASVVNENTSVTSTKSMNTRSLTDYYKQYCVQI